MQATAPKIVETDLQIEGFEHTLQDDGHGFIRRYDSLPGSEYRYRLRNTGYSSARYGVCEVCGEHVSEVFTQTEQRHYQDDDHEGWTEHECKSYFGHKDCLIAKRR